MKILCDDTRREGVSEGVDWGGGGGGGDGEYAHNDAHIGLCAKIVLIVSKCISVLIYNRR